MRDGKKQRGRALCLGGLCKVRGHKLVDGDFSVVGNVGGELLVLA